MKIFGEEASKPLLIDFLNALLPQPDKIVDLNFKNNEQLGQADLDRKAIYDIYCENEKGEKFIVELQKPNKIISKKGQFTIQLFQFVNKQKRANGIII